MVKQYEEEVLDEGQQHGVINRNDSRYSYEHLLDENKRSSTNDFHFFSGILPLRGWVGRLKPAKKK